MLGDPGVIVTVVGVLVDFDPPPRVARKTPAAKATVPPMIAALTQVGDHQPPRLAVLLAFSTTTRSALDIGILISPTWFPYVAVT